MSIIDILTLESRNLFHTEVCAYQVKLKHVKCVAKTVASIGFPDSSLQHLFEATALQKMDEKRLIVSGYAFEQEDYEHWFDAQLSVLKKQMPESTGIVPQIHSEGELKALAMLKNYRVEQSSPFECMGFIVSLQQILDGKI